MSDPVFTTLDEMRDWFRIEQRHAAFRPSPDLPPSLIRRKPEIKVDVNLYQNRNLKG